MIANEGEYVDRAWLERNTVGLHRHLFMPIERRFMRRQARKGVFDMAGEGRTR
jgi:hypothetical protein